MSVPGVRWELAGADRMLLRQDGRAVLFARVHPSRYGVRLFRTGAFRSPVEPVRAGEARRITTAEGWAYRFGGSWPRLPGVRKLPAYCLTVDLLADFPDAELDWCDGWNGVVPLRPLPSPDDGRVKSYRKLARAGVLPPLLLWWASNLDGYLLVDGHSRLAAARAEGSSAVTLAVTPGEYERTRAQPLRGGTAEWDRLAAEAAPAWDSTDWADG
ncbi:ParB/Srx family N-terminal domain-containing protein [Actinoplanes sp. NPDC049802]|uniref:ParB/Srx family N-terminal domain-containing protein n=1 Tax=Actinoplanes sp. NPDC049802 TaxID=3154742 RepID=UPI0034082387